MEDQLLVKYLKSKYKSELTTILEAPSDADPYYVEIEYWLKIVMGLFDTIPEACGFFGENSMASIELLDRSLLEAQRAILSGDNKKRRNNNKENQGKLQGISGGPLEEKMEKMPLRHLKEKIHCKLYDIPVCYETTIKTVRAISTSHINRLIVVKGTALRCGTRKNREISKEFKCRQCEAKFTAYTDIYQFNAYKLPPKCKNMVERQKSNLFRQLVDKAYGKNKQKKEAPAVVLVKGECGSRSFSAVDGTATYIDYQEIRLQETFRTLKPGVIPRAITVILQEGLVDSCNPGDDIEVTGVLIERWRKPVKEQRPQVELAIVANRVVILSKRENVAEEDSKQEAAYAAEFKAFWNRWNENRLSGRSILIDNICPHICGSEEIKLAVLLCVIGGTSDLATDSKRRNQIHLLLAGEPGTGKSQFLGFASQLSSRAVFTTGIGSTSAGLTVAAVKEHGEWILEAGALVLSDCGVCCIDEFSMLKQEDKASIHEAMEQQTISIAKAGIICKINTRSTIIAACNPVKSAKYNPAADLETNFGITGSLLSRFDLVFVVLDQCSIREDQRKADYIFNHWKENESIRKGEIWSVEKLRWYIRYIQREIHPTVSAEAELVLQKYYQHLRGSSLVPVERKTLRMLESLIRLSQAHARLMYRSEILVQDAIFVILLMEHALMTNLLDSCYSCKLSEVEYTEAEKEVLYKLEIDSEELENAGDDYENVEEVTQVEVKEKERIEELYEKYKDFIV